MGRPTYRLLEKVMENGMILVMAAKVDGLVFLVK
jgi:hypothetical protein